jgi:Xaa-Pro aminopeptidase
MTDVYNAVLRVKMKLLNLYQEHWKQYHIEVGKLMTSELLGLACSTKLTQNENPDKLHTKKYFMHGTSHHMGLDTHDYGILTEPMPIWFSQ